MTQILYGFIVISLVNSAIAVPVNQTDAIEEITTDILDGLGTNTSDILDSNYTDKDLYVIRSVVYEIGILTEPENDTDFDNTTHEQIDFTFFDPEGNETLIDLSNIPFPVQTNVSGVSITGIVSTNFGDLHRLNNGTPTINGSHIPHWPGKQVKVTHNVVTSDQNESSSVLSDLPEILGLKQLHLKHKNATDSSEETS